MSIILSIPGIAIVAGIIWLIIWSIRLQAGEYQERYVERQRAVTRSLYLDPAMQAALEAERRYSLESRRLALQEREMAVSQYGTLVFNQQPTGYTFIQPVHKAVPTLTSGDAQRLALPHPQPSQEVLLSTLEENSLTFSPGTRATDGSVVIVPMLDVPHLKIIGSTGFGKSCLAGAILDQTTQLNSPDILQVALLDLEHKTSRLFEDVPHVARLKKGERMVDMVATNADEVVEHLSILKHELDRRTRLSEQELDRNPVLLMYVEEMLALQYEEIDAVFLERMFKDLTILAVRGRKYKMSLLACMQTDYSTKEMQITQKMFRFRSAAAIDTTAARAAGFMNTDLIKENFATGKPGQFVVEYPSFSGIVLAPVFDVKRLVAKKTAVLERETPEPFQVVKATRNIVESDVKTSENDVQLAWEAKVVQVRDLKFSKGWKKIAILEKVWRVKPGATQAYQLACQEYEAIIGQIEDAG